jgi:predicted dithiol-disulfide oxidoreductase (DUF899 family)
MAGMVSSGITGHPVVPSATLARIEAFRKRMAWRFKWLSSFGSDFNFDFLASFTPAALGRGTTFSNDSNASPGMADREGISAFHRDDGGAVFHTCSCYARGIEMVNGTYHVLDLVPTGRDEDPADPQAWVPYHDRYED